MQMKHTLKFSANQRAIGAPLRWLRKGSLLFIGCSWLWGATFAAAQTVDGSGTARPRINQAIDEAQLSTLSGHVRPDVAAARDLGPVEDNLPLQLYLVLRRSPEQQADLDALIARQQDPAAAEYHQWLTPRQFGERFGIAQQDIAKIKFWLESKGFRVNAVLNNAAYIDFSGTARQVSTTFHTQLHRFNVHGGVYPAVSREPMIPAALGAVVASIQGLNKIPLQSHVKNARQVSFDSATHRWHETDARSGPGRTPGYSDGLGDYDVTPQDLYTIYNVNKVFASTGGLNDLGATASIAVIEQSDFPYGSVNATTGATDGGDVAQFRSLFGVPGTLNMYVLHGGGAVGCRDPGIDPQGLAGC